MGKIWPRPAFSVVQPQFGPPSSSGKCPVHTLPVEVLIRILSLAHADKEALPKAITNRNPNRSWTLCALEWLSSLSTLSSLFASACQTLIFRKPLVQTLTQLLNLYETLASKPELASYVSDILFVPQEDDFEVNIFHGPRYQWNHLKGRQKGEMVKGYFERMDERGSTITKCKMWREGIQRILKLCGGSLRRIRMVAMLPSVYLESSFRELLNQDTVPRLECLEFGAPTIRNPVVLDAVFDLLENSQAPHLIFHHAVSFNAPGSQGMRAPRVIAAPVSGQNAYIASSFRRLTLHDSRIAPFDLLHILSVSPRLVTLHLLDTVFVLHYDEHNEDDVKLWSIPFREHGKQLQELTIKESGKRDGIFLWSHQDGQDQVVRDQLSDRITRDIITSCSSLTSFELWNQSYTSSTPLPLFRFLSPTVEYFLVSCPSWMWDMDRESHLWLLQPDEARKVATGLKKLVCGTIPIPPRQAGNCLHALRAMFNERAQQLQFLVDDGGGPIDFEKWSEGRH
ncbi:hypothetical protein BT69DRAFT_1355865 [Atractiella rhizophila]|nr:hypothetical protein BT69DRAFT_1355865 [Atractiella rhizophila]